MNDISGVVASLKREQKALKKRLRAVGKALRNLRGLDALIHEARSGFERGRKKYAHSAKSRQAISRAQKRRWAKLKAGKS